MSSKGVTVFSAGIAGKEGERRREDKENERRENKKVSPPAVLDFKNN
ncbi:hypothetical protein [Sulfuracidifex tepidarius]|uniref:Uncharacterized protein n=1 Tax=Sulfuracidifex tepidarius TaxID=1294262 RepID=A0A510DT01_9CREN|nr:hypothetical protein [Sulfuracidifex tepidarius]BBG23294.1 hypothetical protein IC006_0578 [Sulfuracidifex tepidarius]BBG26047.1 hypothetical protein IC007_0552 [Sulfuracidifex tepidarius]